MYHVNLEFVQSLKEYDAQKIQKTYSNGLWENEYSWITRVINYATSPGTCRSYNMRPQYSSKEHNTYDENFS